MSEIIKQQDTRRQFVETLNELAKDDEKIVVVIADVGFNYLDSPDLNFPVINLGVTEQSAMLVCAGLALAGFKPYFYTMLNFSVFRPFEMIRNGVVLHNANVKILGVKGSEAYKFLGFSHNMVFDDEDVYHLKPYMDCYTPQDNESVKRIIEETYKNERYCYVRL